jgi:hypothetical protein
MVHSSFVNAKLAAAAVIAEVEATAAHLEQLMRNIHGGLWSIDIDHETCFVSVARDGDAPRHGASNQGVAELAPTASSRGAMLLATLERQAQAVASTMKEIHGDDWRIQIEHNTPFVMIAQLGNNCRSKPTHEAQ